MPDALTSSQGQDRQDQVRQDQVRKADKYGLAGYPAIVREPLIAARMIGESGIRTTLSHVWTICLLRFHYTFVDRKRRSAFVALLPHATNAKTPRLRTTTPEEIVEAVHCAPVPSKTILWALKAAGVDASAYHLVDVGSGFGFALAVAADLPFRGLTGVEFAGDFHDMAVRNFEAFAADGTIAPGRVTLKHESALETDLPSEPLLILLANPFGEAVMRQFLARLAASIEENPRPAIVLYINSTQAHLFDRPEVTEIALRGFPGWCLRWLSPFQVRVYRWGT